MLTMEMTMSIMGRWKEEAAVFHEHGPLDNLRYEDFPDPRPGPTEVLLRVRAVALNGFDPMVLRGIPGLKTPLPMIPGADIAGEIVELGAAVEQAAGRSAIGSWSSRTSRTV